MSGPFFTAPFNNSDINSALQSLLDSNKLNLKDIVLSLQPVVNIEALLQGAISNTYQAVTRVATPHVPTSAGGYTYINIPLKGTISYGSTANVDGPGFTDLDIKRLHGFDLWFGYNTNAPASCNFDVLHSPKNSGYTLSWTGSTSALNLSTNLKHVWLNSTNSQIWQEQTAANSGSAVGATAIGTLGIIRPGGSIDGVSELSLALQIDSAISTAFDLQIVCSILYQ